MGEIRTRPRGSLVADRAGRHAPPSPSSACRSAGPSSSGPGEAVYEGVIIGENGRGDDLDVNPTKEKKLTNMRSSTARRAGAAGAARGGMSLDQALEFVRDDECVEVTPERVRLRKVELVGHARAKLAKRGAPTPA